MRTVHVRIGHNNDFTVAELFNIKFIAYTASIWIFPIFLPVAVGKRLCGFVGKPSL